METIVTIYNQLGINRKIDDRLLRMLYLKEIWGLPQTLIAACEGDSIDQPAVSRFLKDARLKYGAGDITNLQAIEFDVDEIKSIQLLPRELLTDVQCVAFVQHILGLDVMHHMFGFNGWKETTKIAALSALGIQQNHLSRIFNKSTAAISITVARKKEKELINNRFRYDINQSYALAKKKTKTAFTKAGGIL